MKNEHKPSRYMYSIEIYDNETKENVAYKSFNTDSLKVIKKDLEEILRKLP